MLLKRHYPTDFAVFPLIFGAFSELETCVETTTYPAYLHIWLLHVVLRRLLRKDEYVPYYRFVDAFSEAANRTSNLIGTKQPPLHGGFFVPEIQLN